MQRTGCAAGTRRCIACALDGVRRRGWTGTTRAPPIDMTPHIVRCYDYVNQPYPRVRDALLANPHYVFRQATAAAAAHAARLHVRIGAIDVGAEVEIRVVGVEQDVAYDQPATRLTLEWKSSSNPRMFPSMSAQLTIFPLSATETQLELAGRYEPPMGKLGEVLDAAVGHRLATVTVTKLIEEVAGWLREELATPAATPLVGVEVERSAVDAEC